MIPWWTLLISAPIFATFGYFICAMLGISKREDDRAEQQRLQTEAQKGGNKSNETVSD